MSSAVLELQSDALDTNVKASDLLRKALVVARKLSLHDFLSWVEHELNGYKGVPEVPEYRQMTGQIRGLNPVHGWVPIIFEDGNDEALFSKRKSIQSIADLAGC